MSKYYFGMQLHPCNFPCLPLDALCYFNFPCNSLCLKLFLENSEKCKLEDVFDDSPKVKEYTLKNYEGDSKCYEYCKDLKGLEADIFTVGE